MAFITISHVCIAVPHKGLVALCQASYKHMQSDSCIYSGYPCVRDNRKRVILGQLGLIIMPTHPT